MAGKKRWFCDGSFRKRASVFEADVASESGAKSGFPIEFIKGVTRFVGLFVSESASEITPKLGPEHENFCHYPHREGIFS